MDVALVHRDHVELTVRAFPTSNQVVRRLEELPPAREPVEACARPIRDPAPGGADARFAANLKELLGSEFWFKASPRGEISDIRVGERGELQFRAEAFNLTNTPSFSAPGTNIDVASGGIVLSTISTPRQIQFALKFNF